MPLAMNGKWEGLVREWGLDRFRMAIDEIASFAKDRSPSGHWKLLRRIFRGWRKAAGVTQDWTRHRPGPAQEDSDD